MPIKVLKGDPSKSIEFSVSHNEGLLLVTLGERPGLCFHFIDLKKEELTKLTTHLDDVESFKYLGCASYLDMFKEHFSDLASLEERSIEITDEIHVSYQASNNKLSFRHVVNGEVKKSVLIIDDSKTIQKMISTIVGSSDKLEVMGIAGCPSEAREILEEGKVSGQLPDLITLDIHMPEMTGVEFLKTYLKDFNIPTIMISSISMEEGPLVLEALASGAQTYIQKPTFEDLKKDMGALRERLEVIALSSTQAALKKPQTIVKNGSQNFIQFDGLIAIGSSTGGTQALQFLFESLPKHIPPIVVTQHIPAVFSKALADRLNSICPFTIKEVEDGELLEKDTIYIAPGGKQFKIHKRGDRLRTEVNDDPPMNRFKPSVDYLFKSIENCEIENLVGVILTGMGRDGAQGLLNLKNVGAHTIAQDEESSVVFGMPKAAIELGAQQEITSLDSMATRIVEAFNRQSLRNKKNAS